MFDRFQWWRGEGTCSNSGWRKDQKIEEKKEDFEKKGEDADKMEIEEQREHRVKGLKSKKKLLKPIQLRCKWENGDDKLVT